MDPPIKPSNNGVGVYAPLAEEVSAVGVTKPVAVGTTSASSSAASPLQYAYVEEDGSGAVPLSVSEEENKFIDQADAIIRHGFIRKVFGLLGVQLAVTGSVIALFSLYDPITVYVGLDEKKGGHSWVFILAMVVSITCILALACFPQQARIYPNNYAFLGVFTLAESVLLGVVCAAYTADSILIAVAVTAVITLGLMFYAFRTKTDWTGAGPYLFMALWCLIIYGFILGLFPVLRQSVQTAYSFIGVVIFSFYIVYDVQLIIGGKHNRFRFEIDEHVFATLNIYLDVINLFLRILAMFGRRR